MKSIRLVLLTGKRTWIGAACVIVILGGFIWWKQKSAGLQSQQYQTALAEKGTLVVSLSSAGQISTTNTKTVSTKVTGVVSDVFVRNGQKITMGDPIASVTLDQDAQQSYTQALASLQSARNNLESAKTTVFTLQSKLFAANQTFINGAVARNLATTDPTYIQQNADWLAAEAQYKNQQAVIAQAQTAYSSAAQNVRLVSPTMYAPISGVISGLSLQEGTVIASNSDSSGSSTGQTIAQVTTGAMQTMVVNLTEIDVVNVRIGNKATITVDAIPDKTFTGKVISIDTTGSISSGVTSYPAVIAFDSAIENIYPNMSATASIITATKADVLLVPTSAVKTQNGESTVLVLENGLPHSQIVKIGLRSNTQTEIISGITEGQTVITSTTARNSGQSTRNQTSSPFSGFSGGSFGAGQNTIRMIR